MCTNMKFCVEKQSIINSVQVKEPTNKAPSLIFLAWGLVRNTFIDSLGKRSKYVKLCCNYNYSNGSETVLVNVSYPFKANSS